MRGRPLKFDGDEIRRAYEEASKAGARSHAACVRAVMIRFGCSAPTIARHINERTSSKSPSMSPGKVGEHKRATILPVGHPATMEHRTLFPNTVRDVEDEWVLKSADNSAKIGAEITKGPWKGFAVYTLTLEERATCPVSCRHWGSCYGNNSHWATRWRHGDELEWRLEREVPALELKHRKGFAVRLHSLGDFYSVRYVQLWRRLLLRHPALHVFGYTARADDPIGDEIASTVEQHWPRFAIRFSNAAFEHCSTITLESPVQKPADAVVCPAQWTPSGKKSESCSTCGLCWGTTRRIAFLQH
jgi:hypothetical protein